MTFHFYKHILIGRSGLILYWILSLAYNSIQSSLLLARYFYEVRDDLVSKTKSYLFWLIQVSVIQMIPNSQFKLAYRLFKSTESTGFIYKTSDSITQKRHAWAFDGQFSAHPGKVLYSHIITAILIWKFGFTIELHIGVKVKKKCASSFGIPLKGVKFYSIRQVIPISPGALAQKLCQPGKKCRKLKFSGKLLGCQLKTMVKSPQKSQRRKFFYSRWPPSPLVAYCYTLKSCKFLNICHRKTISGCIPMFWKTENTVESLFQL